MIKKEVVVTTKEGNKFIFRDELADKMVSKMYTDDEDIVHFGDDVLIIPKSNLNYCWVNETEGEE
ncbi:hypothetical protein [Clostridium botulinum]|uniref:hypothetical protein n=1 Tax=Clostridium botulinum TaxID=1491 RepID=UPI0019679D44|nr:hypothetical protein [Clostridium botulinum]MBN1050278.1 hypothetical protein [Clostridium botulinum]